jgi:hypothetical protein
VPTLPESLERIALKALAKSPEDRYQNAEEMASALRGMIQEVGIELPTRISLPLSFFTSEAPSESVAVLSGTARAKISDAQFAGEETDVTLGQRLETEISASQTTGRAIRHEARPRPLSGLPAPESVRSSAQVGESVARAATSLFALIAAGASRVVPGVVRFLDAEIRGRVGKAVLSAVGILVVYNLVAVWVGGLTGWWIFEKGWPLELLVVGLGLCVVMYAMSSIWLLIPACIVLGNGLILSYCQVTGNWRHWAYLWLLELLLIGGAVWSTIWMARQKDQARRLSRPLGCALGVAAVIWSAIVAVLALVAAIVS